MQDVHRTFSFIPVEKYSRPRLVGGFLPSASFRPSRTPNRNKTTDVRQSRKTSSTFGGHRESHSASVVQFPRTPGDSRDDVALYLRYLIRQPSRERIHGGTHDSPNDFGAAYHTINKAALWYNYSAIERWQQGAFFHLRHVHVCG